MTRTASAVGNCIAPWESPRSRHGSCCIAFGLECLSMPSDLALTRKWETAAKVMERWKWTKLLSAAGPRTCTGIVGFATHKRAQSVALLARQLCSACWIGLQEKFAQKWFPI